MDGHSAVSIKLLNHSEPSSHFINKFYASGIGSEICARIMESETFFHLDAPVMRVTGVDIPMPYAKSLEIASIPKPLDVVEAVQRVLSHK